TPFCCPSFPGRRFHLPCFLNYIVNRSDIKEGCFRIFIHLSVYDGAESSYRFRNRHILARNSDKVLCHIEVLREISLYLSFTVYRNLSYYGKLLYSDDRDDILQLLVFMKGLLHPSRRLIMFFTDDIYFQDPQIALQWIYGRIDSLLYDLSRK